MVHLFELFWVFFKIGGFTIGGGYAMIPLMESELVRKKQWLGQEDFLDFLALSQAMPGIFAVNMASSIGYKLRGYKGAVISVAGNIMLPIIVILAIAVVFCQYKDNEVVEAVFKGLRPAVVALIAAPVFSMAKTSGLSFRNCWIPVLAAVLIWMFGVSPVWIIIAAGTGGYVYGRFRARKGGLQ